MRGELLQRGYGGAIDVPPRADLPIGGDGTIPALIPPDPPAMLGQIGRPKVVEEKPQKVLRGEDGMFHLTAAAHNANGNELPLSERGKVSAGELEGSNVNPAPAMVEMIAKARHFEMKMKVVNSAEENAQRANQQLAAGS
ncbi:flagellar basal body rod C-terminal domain-containing protein, partial [Morganella morganii]|uniref:flagellar basal body rod C-terminal domain-containing protein n=1 Tax=Morganella morganii TaxID=582 RepID=UPI002493D7E2